MLGHACGLVAIDDFLLLALEMSLPAHQAGDAAGKRIAARPESIEGALFSQIDVAHLLGVLIDGPAGVGPSLVLLPTQNFPVTCS